MIGGLRMGKTPAAVAVAAVLLAGCNAPRGPAGDVVHTPPPPPIQPTRPAEPEPMPTVDSLGRPVPDDRTAVALLVPLSGPNAQVGHGMLRAAELALFDVGNRGVALLPFDTQGNSLGAEAAARAAIDAQADVILGPLFGNNVPAVARIAGSAMDPPPVISFTTTAEVAGGPARVMGLVPQTEIETIADYALAQGMTRFAALAPDNGYGRVAVSTLTDRLLARGGFLDFVQFYAPDGSDLRDAAAALAGRAVQESEVLVDAVLIPDVGVNLRSAVPLLAVEGMVGVQLLGTGLWDRPDIGTDEALHGGWFAAPDPESREVFRQSFEQAFDQAPIRIATVAYDAAALAAALASLGGPIDPFGPESLGDPNGFVGTDGVFRFDADGVVERRLAILEITREGPVVREPAALTFGEAEF